MFALMAGALILVAAHHRNGEERIRQSELEARERRHRAVLDVTFDGIALVRAGRVVQANRGFSEIFGPECSGGLVNLFKVDDQPKIEGLLNGAGRAVVEARGMNGRTLEIVGHRREGRPRRDRRSRHHGATPSRARPASRAADRGGRTFGGEALRTTSTTC